MYFILNIFYIASIPDKFDDETRVFSYFSKKN